MPIPARDPRVFRAQLQLVYRLSERSLIASFALSSFLLLFYFGPGDQVRATVWWALLNLVSVARILAARVFLGKAPPPWPLERWAGALSAGTLAVGLLWGYFLAALSPPWGHPGYPISAFIAAGIPAVSVLSTAGLFAPYVGVVVPTVGAYALKLLFWSQGTAYETVGGIAAFLYMVALLLIGYAISRRIHDALVLSFQNADLVERLKASNADLAAEVGRRESTEQGLREATGAAETANAAKSQFLARMSHEIRTPLNGILGMTEILRQTSLSREQTEHAETIDEAGRSLLRVINDILDFSRVEAGKLSLQPKDFAIRDVVDRAVALLRPRALAKGLRLEVDIAAAVPALVNGDAGRLRQILINLVGNAIKFTERGEVSVRVFHSGARSEIFDVAFEVSDTGAGIAPGLQARLFEPFAQSDESYAREHGGTGLGLAICQQLVELMNGVIGLKHSSGAGTTFWFTVRLSPPVGESDEPRGAPLTAVDVMGTLSGHVLLVDDNPVNRMITGEFLKLLGCTSEEASDGEDAVSRGRRPGLDLILMDCEMPRMDGYEAVAQIRRHEEIAAVPRRVPIVALTASALPTDRDRAIATGMDAYLSKPFAMMELYQVVKEFLTVRSPAPERVKAASD